MKCPDCGAELAAMGTEQTHDGYTSEHYWCARLGCRVIDVTVRRMAPEQELAREPAEAEA